MDRAVAQRGKSVQQGLIIVRGNFAGGRRMIVAVRLAYRLELGERGRLSWREMTKMSGRVLEGLDSGERFAVSLRHAEV